MAGFTYSTLTTAIGNYTEVGTSVLSSTITDQFIDNSELRIQRDVPIDADRKEVIGNLVASKDNINVPAGTFILSFEATRLPITSFLSASIGTSL